MLERLASLWASEPVVIVGLVDAVLVLLVSVGVPIDETVKLALDGLLVAIGVFIARSKVSPA